MDAEPLADQEGESPETTLARTRELLARSRATLAALTERLTRAGECSDTSPPDSVGAPNGYRLGALDS